ncbi:MAG TPA: efflux RND transporter periplasmic adaptor subunit [Acidobacteriota bacterium]|nr:efflux RND transporter periplasmic adaptor subunit [Acidobacteriota bacterium]
MRGLEWRAEIWRVLAAAVLFPVLISCISCGQQNNPGNLAGLKGTAVPIQTTRPERITIQRKVDLAGTLVSIDQARVSSEVAGMVREVLVNLGDEVPAGAVLVRLDPRELEIELRRAESQLRQTEAQLGIDGVRVKTPPPDEEIAAVRTAAANRDDARAQLERATRLRSRNLLAQADLDAAETRVKVTEAAYQAALENVHSLKASLQERRAAFELAQKKLADAVIRAPVAGSVSERLVHPGEFIRENTPVIGLVQLHPLKVSTGIQERHAAVIRPGLPVQFQVESFPGKTFEGKVAYISPAVDQGTRTFAVEVLVDNQNRQLKPGFFAKGTILVQRDENVLAVPEETISTLAGVSAVFVVEGDKVRQQTVELGAREGKYVEILSGLTGDEVLASTNLSQLANGVEVEVTD